MTTRIENLLLQVERHRASGHKHFFLWVQWKILNKKRTHREYLAFADKKELQYVFMVLGITGDNIVATTILPVRKGLLR